MGIGAGVPAGGIGGRWCDEGWPSNVSGACPKSSRSAGGLGGADSGRSRLGGGRAGLGRSVFGVAGILRIGAGHHSTRAMAHAPTHLRVAFGKMLGRGCRRRIRGLPGQCGPDRGRMLEANDRLPELQPIAVAQKARAGLEAVVDERAIARSVIDEAIASAVELEGQMLARDRDIGEHDVVVQPATHGHGLAVELDLSALILAGNDDELAGGGIIAVTRRRGRPAVASHWSTLAIHCGLFQAPTVVVGVIVDDGLFFPIGLLVFEYFRRPHGLSLAIGVATIGTLLGGLTFHGGSLIFHVQRGLFGRFVSRVLQKRGRTGIGRTVSHWKIVRV